MSNSFYVVSKPLQYFNVINISDLTVKKTCLIVDNFYQAEAFFESIKCNSYWYDVLFFNSSFDAYIWLKMNVKNGDNLFIDSDYGLKKNLWLSRIKSKNIYVYEEGIGSYRNDLLKTGSRCEFVKFVLKLLGVKEYMGGGPFTKGIIIYDVEKHKRLIKGFRKKRINFENSFQRHLTSESVQNSFKDISTNLIIDNLVSKNVFMYLTDFKYNNSVDLLITQYSSYVKILKPHPNIKDVVNKNHFDVMIDNSVLIEFFIMQIIKRANKLILVHENSSAVQYLSSYDNLTLVDLNTL